MNPEFRQIIEALDELSARQAAHLEQTRLQTERIEELTRRTDGLEQNLTRTTAEIRKAHVLIEDNRSVIELVAEGVSAANQRIDSLKEEMNQRFDSQESFFRSTLGHLATSHGGRLDRLERRVGLN